MAAEGGDHAHARARRPFSVMAKPVGPLCNLACSYCYYLEKTALFAGGERYRMREEVLEAYVAAFFAAHRGPDVYFVWHGGEPTLAGLDFYRRVLELQQRLVPAGVRVHNNLQTNGTLLDDRWCSFLAEHHFLVGISLDGPAELHDASRPDRRGRPTHARALAGLRALRAHGIDPDVLCTLNAKNVSFPESVYHFFLDEGVHWLQFLPVVRRGPQGELDPWSVRAEAMGTFLCRVFDEWIRYDVARIGIQNFLEPLLVVAGQGPNLCVMAKTCGTVLALEHDGALYSCDHFVDPAHRLGRVQSDGLSSLVCSRAQVAFGEAKHATLPPSCRSCPVAFLCQGGCPKDRIVIDDAGGFARNVLCEGYRSSYLHMLPRLSRMAELARRGQPIAKIMTEVEHTEADRAGTTGRNDPCPCGSGRKYKQCCLRRRGR